jgi:xanthine dehydrogenase large subunit
MLAISVREALREAVAAFAGDRRADHAIVTFPIPSTPERVFFAIRDVKNMKKK